MSKIDWPKLSNASDRRSASLLHDNVYHTPASTKLKERIMVSYCPSARSSVRGLWTESCPLCISHNTSWIHVIFTQRINQLQDVCHLLRFLKNSKIRIYDNFFDFVTLTFSFAHVMWMLMLIPHLSFHCSQFWFSTMLPLDGLLNIVRDLAEISIFYFWHFFFNCAF